MSIKNLPSSDFKTKPTNQTYGEQGTKASTFLMDISKIKSLVASKKKPNVFPSGNTYTGHGGSAKNVCFQYKNSHRILTSLAGLPEENIMNHINVVGVLDKDLEIESIVTSDIPEVDVQNVGLFSLIANGSEGFSFGDIICAYPPVLKGAEVDGYSIQPDGNVPLILTPLRVLLENNKYHTNIFNIEPELKKAIEEANKSKKLDDLKKIISEEKNQYIHQEIIAAVSFGLISTDPTVTDYLKTIKDQYLTAMDQTTPYKRVPNSYAHLVVGIARQDTLKGKNFMAELRTAPLVQ